ncbi:MAG: MATE family efflux transporter [Gammaproteobacteria bacterium]
MATPSNDLNRARLTRGPEGQTIRSMMYPMLIGMLSMVSYNLADTYFIGQLGAPELAAVSFTFPVVFFVGAVTVGLGNGTSAVCARLFGEENIADVGRVAVHAMMLGVVAGLVFLVIGLMTIDPLFRLLGADSSTLEIIHRYMRIYYFGGVFMVLPLIVNPVLRAAGDARTPAVIMITAATLKIALAPVLIFGLLGSPRLGIEGAAISTVVANVGAMIASFCAIYFRDRLISIGSLSLNLLMDSWRRILHVGLPSMASTVIGPVTTAFITSQVARFGHEAVAGYGVASRVEGLVSLVLMALSVAVTPFVGQNFGAGKFDRVDAGIRWANQFSLGYGLVIAALLALGGPAIVGVFTDSETAIHAASLHMRVVPMSYLALGIAMTATNAFNAVGRPLPGMLISMMRTILVYAPLAYILAREFGLPGIFAAACTANFAAGICGFGLVRKVFAGFHRADLRVG